MYMPMRVAALFTTSSSTRRPKRRTLLRLRNTATALAASTATVVIFMPPAVDPGAPPTSMSPRSTDRPLSDMAERSPVLKPAVRGVTA